MLGLQVWTSTPVASHFLALLSACVRLCCSLAGIAGGALFLVLGVHLLTLLVLWGDDFVSCN